MKGKEKSAVYSEIGKLEAIILHKPGKEVENMNPSSVERALYSDILNLSVAREEYSQMYDIIKKYSQVFEVGQLLEDILYNEKIRTALINKICKNENALEFAQDLIKMPPPELSAQLIEGVELKKNTLTSFLSPERYILRPLHNFFFTRDASITMCDKVLISKMKSNVRERESIIMEAIFDYNPLFKATTMNPVTNKDAANITIEGGDVLIARDDIILVGIGGRTTSQGVDYILEQLKSYKKDMHIVVQELPLTPESFIHLDMVFTFLDKDLCMIYEPLILKQSKYQTVRISWIDAKVEIHREENILSALKKLGLDLKPLICGGNNDIYVQEREQWHSGANFFALAPGKVMGYGRNVYTLEEMNKNGFEIIEAGEILCGEKNPDDYRRAVITIEGSELSRGGGGCRCMTMPVRREKIDWDA